MRILVLNLLNIGDLLFSTPALRALRRAYPAAHIDLLVNERIREVVAHSPDIDAVIGIPKRARALPFLRQLLAQLRANRYDMAISFHDAEWVSLLTCLSGAKRRYGHAAPAFRPFFHRWSAFGTETIHEVEVCLRVLEDIGVPTADSGPMSIYVDPASRERAEAKWAAAGLAAAPVVIGLNPGASTLIKRWTAAGFAGVIDRVRAAGYAPVLFGAADEQPLVDAILALTAVPPAVLTGRLTLLECAALIGKCAVFVSGDTGPLHMAAAQRVPVVALHIDAEKTRRYGPYATPHIVLHPPIAPFGLPSTVSWLADITPDAVFAAVTALFAEKSPAP